METGKLVISAASYYVQKYYSNPEFDGLPTSIRNQLRELCILMSEKLRCNFSIGFYKDGSVFIETTAEESDYDYDEIGTALEIKRFEKEAHELLKAMKLWYEVIYTKNRI